MYDDIVATHHNASYTSPYPPHAHSRLSVLNIAHLNCIHTVVIKHYRMSPIVPREYVVFFLFVFAELMRRLLMSSFPVMTVVQSIVIQIGTAMVAGF